MGFNGWKEVKLGEVGAIVTGKTPSSKTPDHFGDIVPFVTPTDFKNYHKQIFSAERYLSQKGKEGLNGKVLPKNSVVVTCIGSDMGKVAINSVECVTNQQINSIITNEEKVDANFLYYKISSMDEYLKQLARGGTTMPIVNKGTFEQINIQLPSLPEQKVIAGTLSCLDDKIELNNRINKNLVEIAQAIFKSWFVDFEPFQDGEFEDSELGRIPKGWRVGILGDIANITMGQSPSGSSYNENNDGMVFYQGRTDFGKRYPTIRLYTTEPKRMAAKGDVLLSVRAPVGDINVASESCCIGRGLATLKSKNKCNSFLLYQLLNMKDSFNIYNGEGTVFGSINKNSLNNMRVIIPTEKNIQEFQSTVGKLDEIYENNSIQIKTLTAIQNTLLSKLMSGEIRVPIEEV